MILATVETSRFTSAVGDTETISLFNKRNSKLYYIDDDLSDGPVSFQTEIVSEDPLPKEVQRAVEKWLFFKRGYAPLFFDVDDDCKGETWDMIEGRVKRYYLNCRFINPSKMEYEGGVVGYRVTVECDSPCAWQEPMVKEFSFSHGPSGSTNITIDVDTDMNEYIYPVVNVTVGATGGDISIINTTDSTERVTSFKGIPPIAQFKMDGDTNYLTTHYDKFQNRNFIRLLDGQNILRVAGDITKLSFEWRNRRYL